MVGRDESEWSEEVRQKCIGAGVKLAFPHLRPVIEDVDGAESWRSL